MQWLTREMQWRTRKMQPEPQAIIACMHCMVYAMFFVFALCTGSAVFVDLINFALTTLPLPVISVIHINVCFIVYMCMYDNPVCAFIISPQLLKLQVSTDWIESADALVVKSHTQITIFDCMQLLTCNAIDKLTVALKSAKHCSFVYSSRTVYVHRRLKPGSQYDARTSIASRASGWCRNRLNFYYSIVSRAFSSGQPIRLSKN